MFLFPGNSLPFLFYLYINRQPEFFLNGCLQVVILDQGGRMLRLLLRVPLVKQGLNPLPEHLSSPPVFSGVRVTRSVILCVMFCRSLFVLLSFSLAIVLSVLRFIDLWITPLVSSNSSYQQFEPSSSTKTLSIFYPKKTWSEYSTIVAK